MTWHRYATDPKRWYMWWIRKPFESVGDVEKLQTMSDSPEDERKVLVERIRTKRELKRKLIKRRIWNALYLLNYFLADADVALDWAFVATGRWSSPRAHKRVRTERGCTNTE